MTQSKKRLARIGIIAASFMMVLALGVAVWAAGNLPIQWSLGNSSVKTDFECPATLVVTCNLEGGYFADGNGDEITDGSEVYELNLDQDSASPNYFSDIVLTSPSFTIIYEFAITCPDAVYFENLNYAVSPTLGTGLEGTCTTENLTGDFLNGDTINLTYTVKADTGLVNGAELAISFVVTISVD